MLIIGLRTPSKADTTSCGQVLMPNALQHLLLAAKAISSTVFTMSTLYFFQDCNFGYNRHKVSLFIFQAALANDPENRAMDSPMVLALKLSDLSWYRMSSRPLLCRPCFAQVYDVVLFYKSSAPHSSGGKRSHVPAHSPPRAYILSAPVPASILAEM